MKKLFLVGLFLVGPLEWSGGSAQEAACEPDGDVQFLCGPVSPEDLAPIPETPWVIVAAMVDGGGLHLADIRDHSSDVVFPTATSEPRHDTTTYGACPGPVTRDLRPHGLYLRPGAGDVHTLFVVGHGAREAIEVFEVDMSGNRPSLSWIGCSVAPEGLGLNSVVGLPDGGFVVTSPATRDIWEWHPDGDWVRVPGSEEIGPNGIEISADGETLFVGGYGDQALIRLSRGRDPVETPYPECDQSATVGSEQGDSPEKSENVNCLNNGQLGIKKTACHRLSWKKMNWAEAGSNRRHMDFQSIALPTELPDRIDAWRHPHGRERR